MSTSSELTAQVGTAVAELNTAKNRFEAIRGETEQRVKNKTNELDAWKSNLKADQIGGVGRYEKTIDLTGLPTDHFFPVWWDMPGNNHGGAELVISRDYSENGGTSDPFQEGTPNHVAGLLLQLSGTDVPWGGNAHYLNIKRISQTYRETVRSIDFAMKCIARPMNGTLPLYGGAKTGDIVVCMVRSGCYLRGGLTYHVITNWDSGLTYSREFGEVEIASSRQGTFEIKWVAKAYQLDDVFLGSRYPDKLVANQYHTDQMYAAKA